MATPHLLLIDDDSEIVWEQVRHTFPGPSYDVRMVSRGEEGIDAVRQASPDVVLLDVHLPDRSGLDVYRSIRALDARIPVIFITTSSAAETAIAAMKQGALDYLQKPLDLSELRRLVGAALEIARMRAPVALPGAAPAAPATEGMVGASKAMLEIYKAIGRVAAQDVTVLITGESGTGKELVARAIYQHSARSRGPFLALNCAAIPENLLESELFGHEKGSFTGAERRRIGKFEQSDGGTILLDEIGDMPVLLQAKILRLLQEKTFERVGGNEPIHVDVRLIASTHRDLKALAEADRFRADLYYRLSGFTIHVPPLRDRLDDLPMLVQHFLATFGREMGREIRGVAPAALERLRGYAWPGNVRELQNVVRQTLLRANETVLLASFLPELSAAAAGPAPKPAFDLAEFIRGRLSPTTDDLFDQTHREVDRLLLTLALEYTRGNHREAAKLLGISRQTMRLKLRALDLHLTHSVESGAED